MKSLNIYSDNRNKGFTLIEMLIVIGIIALIGVFSVLIGFDSIGRASIHNERDLSVLMLVGARTRAIANINQSRQGVYITASDITVFEGDSYSVGTNKRISPRNDAITVSPVPFEIVFDRLSGNVFSGAGSFALSDGTRTDTISVNGIGRIEW